VKILTADLDHGTLSPNATFHTRQGLMLDALDYVSRFRITPSDDLENPITAGTATGAWSVIVKAANRVRNR